MDPIPKPTQLRPSNPHFHELRKLFSTRGLEGHTSLPLNDGEINAIKDSGGYSRPAVANLFKNWKSELIVSRADGGAAVCWLQDMAPSGTDIRDAALQTPYFETAAGHGNKYSWPRIERFKVEIQKVQHNTSMETLRTLLIGAVAERVATSSRQLSKKSGDYLVKKRQISGLNA